MPEVKFKFDVAGALRLAETFRMASNAITGEVVWTVGTPLQYGVYQEFGTSRHPAQPYLRPAAKAAANRARAHVQAADDLEDAVRRLAMDVKVGSKDRAPVRTGRLRDSIQAERVK